LDQNPWYVVYVSSRQEKKAEKYLTKNGIASYLPLARKLRQWSDRKKWVDFPMFNGYLFVRPTDHQIDEVLQAPGVVAYLKFERKYACVTEKEIEVIRTIESAGYHVESIHTSDEFEIGEKVLVMEGPLKSQIGQLIRKNNETIFLVTFETLGLSIKVNMPYELLKKLEIQD